MLRVDGLGKAYDGRWIFQGVSFDVAPGQLVAILGESGVGKSTLLNALAGLDSMQAGRIHLGPVEVTSLGAHELTVWRRRHVGFIFQAFHVLPHLSVAQNVALPLLLLGESRAPRTDRVTRMLRAVGLEGFEDREPRTLSGGQLQRVAIARAMVHRPALLLADEPTGNLDPDTAEKVMALLRAQAHELGAACVLVTHSDAAARWADQVLRLGRQGIERG